MSVEARIVEVETDAVRVDNDTGTAESSGQALAILNEGAGTVYLGGAEVTVEDGYPLAVDAQIAFQLEQGDLLYAVSDTSATLRLLDLGV